MVNIRGRKLINFGLVAVDIVVAGAFAANIVITHAAKGKTYSDVTLIPHQRVGLVLGSPKRVADGRLNLFFLGRVKAAAELYRQGKVDYLLASGDNGPGDDEPADLKSGLISQGVPAEKVYLDYAGFRTLDSVVRAKEVFGQTQITIISQEFQNQRAIFIANHSRLDAIGFNAPDVFSGRTVIRESLARVKAVLDVYLFHTQPRFRERTVAIGNTAQGLTAAGKALPKRASDDSQ
ncbi:MAG: protein SanA [Verrucomicrobia bacterium]|nr:MAG: protein SanA [Verrucomicrobiota bacterium]PYU19173.1 MAG: protein SanA [Acidobacteriota bacterium]